VNVTLVAPSKQEPEMVKVEPTDADEGRRPETTGVSY